MNPALLLLAGPTSIKRLVYAVIVLIVLIVSLPVVAVFSFSNLPLAGYLNGGAALKQTIFTQPPNIADLYDYGYCTYWAALRRLQIGKPIPNNWGNAITWNTRALAAGYIVNHTPSYGAIFQWPEAPGGEGHVAFVEQVNPVNGAWTISEMNAVGWDVVDYRTYPAAAAADYNFIHSQATPTSLAIPATPNGL